MGLSEFLGGAFALCVMGAMLIFAFGSPED